MSSARRSRTTTCPVASGDRGRWSSRRKTQVVLGLLRGEDLDSVSRKIGVTAAAMSGWRDRFVAGGQAAVRSREADERDGEIVRMQAKIGEITMENELLRERARRAEANSPLVSRRSRP
jgi:hypothetical protein